jgi:SAM domain (Sterile alpha motif)
MDIVVWLRSLGLEEYEAAFRDNKINERVLPNLTQEDLKEIGVGPVGHRRILLEAICAPMRPARRLPLTWRLRPLPRAPLPRTEPSAAK